jgi:hypothetical protein
MANTYEAIATVTVTGATAASMDFTSIPQTYTDLLIKYSGRVNAAVDPTLKIIFNSNTSNYSSKVLNGDGTAAGSYNGSTAYAYGGYVCNSAHTANTFSNGEIYIPNYTSSNNKSVSVDDVIETNATESYVFLAASLWSDSAAITSISLDPVNADLVQYSTATLYGIKNS